VVIGGSQVAGWSTQPDPNPEIAGDRRKASYTTTWGTIPPIGRPFQVSQLLVA
jgi:hypothetical protein